MTEVGMNRPGSLSAMRGSMNNRLGAIGDIASSKDSWGAGSQGLRIDQQAAPRSHSDAGSFRQERGIRCFADSDQDDIHRKIELSPQQRDWLAASFVIRFAQGHALATHAAHLSR